MKKTLVPILSLLLAWPAGTLAGGAKADGTLPADATADTPSIARLAWLAGCWEARGDTRSSREHWMHPEGGSLIGMSRSVSHGRTVAYEFLRIEEREDGLFFVAHPSGQETAEFRAIAVDDSSVTFENPEHDFPQRIAYHRLADGSLRAEISGETENGPRTVPFPMQRASCTE